MYLNQDNRSVKSCTESPGDNVPPMLASPPNITASVSSLPFFGLVLLGLIGLILTFDTLKFKANFDLLFPRGP